MAAGEPTCWSDVQEEEERLANLPPDLIEPLIPLPGPRRANDGLQNALEDPLGVAPAKALELALTRAREPDASFTAGSISLSSADFNPIVFLAEVHKDTKLEDLLAGMATLNSIVASQTTQMKTLAQENFDQFVLCKDTIDEIAGEINKVESSADGTAELVKEVTLLHNKAQSFFSPLLEQKAQGDRARRHLEALKRYDFLLRLPRAIEEHTAKEEYEQVVANYSRAKMLLSGKTTTRRTKVVIRILSEVEERVAALRSRLYRRLDAAELPKEEAKRLIRVLSELDGQPDPAEYYLSKQRSHVRRLLLAVKVSSTSPAKSIRKLRNIFSTHAIDLWRLSVTLSAADGKRKEQFVALISELAQIFSQQVRSTVLENKAQQQVTAVREAVAELTLSAVAVSEAQLPASVVETVQKLQIEIVQSLIADLAAQTRRDAGLLYLEQDWRTGLHGTTSMPSDFALLFREALAQLRAIIPTDNDALEKQGAAALLDSARAFADSLHHLGVTQRLAGLSTSSIIRLQADEQVLSVSPHKQLLLTLADCIYTRSTLLPELEKAASKLLPRAAADIQKGLEDLLDTFRHLESLVSAKYLRAHAAEVRHALLGGFSNSDWMSSEEPQGVSPFILRALLVVAAASSDLAAVVPALHSQVVGSLAEVTLQSLSDAVAGVEEASPRGAVQLEVDLTIMQTALSRFRTPATDAWLSQLSSTVRHLQPKNRSVGEKEEKERLVASVLARCTAMLDSLRPR